MLRNTAEVAHRLDVRILDYDSNMESYEKPAYKYGIGTSYRGGNLARH